VVLGINIVDRKITLSMRDTRPDPWEEVVKNIQPGQLVRGKVVTIIPQGCLWKLLMALRASYTFHSFPLGEWTILGCRV